jgi:hypothetical protein
MAEQKLGFVDYVKAAFNYKVKVPAMGKVPVNWLGLLGVGAASLISMNPFFLLIGAGLELSYLMALSTDPRFQKVVQGMELMKKQSQWDEKKNKILERLSQAAQGKFRELENKCQKVVTVYEAASIETGRLDTSRLVILNQLLWTSLRLLNSREMIIKNIKNEPKEALQRKIDNLEKSFKSETSERTKKTLESTIDIMKKRFDNINSADEKIKNIDLELLRIEEQLELLQNLAAMDGGQTGGALSEKIDSLASSINETSEWMKTNAELFAPLEEEMGETPSGLVDTSKLTDRTK